MTAALELQGVERRHRNGRGVGPCELSVEAGERVALMGPNGAGKTTLLRLLATADAPELGRVLWNGSASVRAARRRLGFAPDESADDPALTGRQAAHFWCSQWLRRGAVRRNVTAGLVAFALDRVADEPVRSYSYGMRRRLVLVQALAHDPELALLDEPTAGLDPEGRDALTAAMAERTRRGRTTVVATNDPNFAEQAATRIVFLHDGRLIRDASPVQLLRETRLERRADLEIAGEPDLAALQGVRGVRAVARRNGTVSVELDDRSALVSLVAVADAPSGRLRGVRLRDPDLADSFRMLTGVDLRDPAQ